MKESSKRGYRSAPAGPAKDKSPSLRGDTNPDRGLRGNKINPRVQAVAGGDAFFEGDKSFELS